MRFVLPWILFGAPLGAIVFAWVGLCRHWSADQQRLMKVSALVFPTVAALLAYRALAYVQFVRPIAAFDYRVEAWGFFLSFARIALGLATIRSPRWFSSLALGASAWMCVLFFLMASSSAASSS
jgi:hypothetical protein